MSKKCLMIETPDHRKFFTHEKNYKQLVEFGKTFGAEISVVKADDAEILDLVSLAPALCDRTYNKKTNFEIVEIKLSKKGRTRKNLLSQATVIRNTIRTKLLSGKEVKIGELAKKFEEQGLSLACFCNHMREVRKELEASGKTVTKVKRGVYKLT